MNLSLSANLFLSTNNSGIGTRYNSPDLIADFSKDSYFVKGVSKSFNEVFEFNRASSSYYTDGNGLITEAVVDEPRLVNHIWENGELKPAGIAVCSEVRTNLVRYSEALDVSAHWPQTYGISVEPAGELSGIPAFRLTDANTDGFSQINQTSVNHGGGVHVFKMLIAKDQNPTSQFSIRLVYSVGGVSKLSGVSVKVNTGTPINNWNNNVLERKVEDLGDHWFVWFAVDLTGASSVTVQLFPAHYNENGASGSAYVGSHVCTAVHFHSGRYPQDYIKTEASPVSTASETLQIDPVKLAKAVGVFGPELPLTSSSAAAWDAETKIATYPGGSYGAIHADLPDGEIAFVSGNLATGGTIQVKQNDGATYPLIYEGSDGYFEGLIIGANGVGLRIYLNDNASYPAATITNLQVRKVTMPTHLGLAIEGYMTYEDEGLNPQVRMMLWQADANNRMRNQINTVDGRTGSFIAFTQESGVANSIVSPSDTYSPGVNVYFSVASRLEVGDFNAAHEGSILSAAAPVAIPNLMGSAFQLVTLGNMNLTRVLLWSSPLEDDNLVEITS